MKFEEVLPSLREGKKIRRKSWLKPWYIEVQYNYLIIDNRQKVQAVLDLSLSLDDFKAQDWEIVKEIKKVKLRDITIMQYINHYKKWFCKRYGCDKCPLKHVHCSLDIKACWVRYKNLYNDKFLDQEIEVEENNI